MDRPPSARAHGLPPKLGIKKRKPRPAFLTEGIDGRGRKDAPSAAVARAPPAAVLGEDEHENEPDEDHTIQDHSMSEDAPSRRDLLLEAAAVAAGAMDRGGSALAHEAIPETVESGKRKGLRHFAVRVSKKVEEKNVTTYNEVADELVAEESERKRKELEAGGKNAAALEKKLAKSGSLVDEKNIRRRVYDSLNVLMAMGIIEKDKKLITWRGLAMARGGSSQPQSVVMRNDIADRRKALVAKQELLTELDEQTRLLAVLIQRNAASRRPPLEGSERQNYSAYLGFGKNSRTGSNVSVADRPEAHTSTPNGSPALKQEDSLTEPGKDQNTPNKHAKSPARKQEPTSAKTRADDAAQDRLPLPFILVATAEDSQIEIEIDQLREEASFTFSMPFAVFDHREMLRRVDRCATGSLSAT